MKDRLSVIGKMMGWSHQMKQAGQDVAGAERYAQDIDLTADYVAGRDLVRDGITGSLGQLVKRRRAASGMALVIYLDDTYNYQMAVSGNLADYIGTFIEANTDYQFKQYLLRLGKPDIHDVAVKVLPGISIALRLPVEGRQEDAVKPVERKVSYPAVIGVLDGYGSLSGGTVELLPIEGKVYNIGIGKVMVIGSHKVRRNEIAVDDDAGHPMFMHNRFVSREHARIIYRAGRGYYLYAEERGTPVYGKYTEISRDTGVIRLDTPRTGQLLQDGDSIILNKKVILTFKERKIHENV
jgi:hypothetical protein